MLSSLRAPTLTLAAAVLVAAVLWLQHAAANSAVLALGCVAGLAATAWLARGERRDLRHERELVEALGEPLLAAHPATPAAVRALARQLEEHWFALGRRVLPIVDSGEGEIAAAIACDLARALAAGGEPVLLVDADLRSPALHERFGVARVQGLADGLDGLDSRDFRVVRCAENLALLGAGTPHPDPLELLGRPRLQRVLGAAGAPFRAVVVRTAPVSRGPDFEIFAALAGGALVFAARRAGSRELAALRRRLEQCSARLVATLVER